MSWTAEEPTRAHQGEWVLLRSPDHDFRLAVPIPSEDSMEAGEEQVVQVVYPCRACNWDSKCGTPPGSECHS